MINHVTARRAFEILQDDIHYSYLRKISQSSVAMALEFRRLPTGHTADVYAMIKEHIVPLHKKGFLTMFGDAGACVHGLNVNRSKKLIVEVSGKDWLERFHSECFIRRLPHYSDMKNLGFYILADTGSRVINCELCDKPLTTEATPCLQPVQSAEK